MHFGRLGEMFCFSGKRETEEELEAQSKNKRINRLIRADERKISQEVKLLLLGQWPS